MKRQIKNGWMNTSSSGFWAHYRNGRGTGLTIALIPPWPPEKPENPTPVYHARFHDKDIGSKGTLREAKRLAEGCLATQSRNVL